MEGLVIGSARSEEYELHAAFRKRLEIPYTVLPLVVGRQRSFANISSIVNFIQNGELIYRARSRLKWPCSHPITAPAAAPMNVTIRM